MQRWIMLGAIALLVSIGCCKPQMESSIQSVEFIETEGPGLSDEAMYQNCELEEADVVLVVQCWSAYDLVHEEWFALQKTRQLPSCPGLGFAGCGGDVGLNGYYQLQGLPNDEVHLTFSLTWRDYRPNAVAEERNLDGDFAIPVGVANCRPIESGGGVQWHFETGADFRAEEEARRAQHAAEMKQAREQ